MPGVKFPFVIILSLLFCSNTISQTNYLREKKFTYIGVEFNFPQYKKYAYGQNNGWAYNVNIKLKTRKSINLLFELAYAQGGNDFWGEPFSRSDKDATWGNPLFGIEFVSSEKFSYEIGLRIPAVNKKNWWAINAGSDIYFERPGAFSSEFVTLYGIVNFIPFSSEKTSMLLNFGPAVYFSKEGLKPFFNLIHSSKFSYKINPVTIFTGLNLFVYLSGEGKSLVGVTGQFELGITYKIMNLYPSLFYKTGMDSDNGIIGFAIGYGFE